MKSLIIIICLLVPVVVQAGSYPRDPVTKEMVQGPSFSGLYTTALTVNSTTVDMTNFPIYRVTAPADCQVRNMATSSKTGSVAVPIYGGQWNLVIVHSDTKFANFSGCTNGKLEKQPKKY